MHGGFARKMGSLTLGSLFDGSGGFPLGGLLAGITPVWASEVEPFAIRVTSKRMPFLKHYGDITKMNGGAIEPVDIITFGSPCQDMSLAGKRNGLGGSRSSLFYEAIRIIKEMRRATSGKYPRYIVWENVPGAFSSSKGRDFKAVLDALIGVVEEKAEVPMPENGEWAYADIYMGDRWSIAYRVFDAQYWGVPQRRRRIYLVADLAGGSAGDVLFKSEGLSGYSAEIFRAWQRTANGLEESVGTPDDKSSGGSGGVSWDGRKVAPTLTKQNAGGNQRMPDKDNFNCILEPFGFSLLQENNTERKESKRRKRAVYAMTTGSYIKIEKDRAPTLLQGTTKIRMWCVSG